ncbi:DUF2461 domain-containing protein [Flammeovirga yaeyamensis]|uniref:DUF2461 domain-containing protein n=1 Tax=Flammeovirga yaeyamensis TaxID=367791 RepID=UPI00146C2ECD|nr:DUF2461 domain-containing protein [Flammeovirga yaeyamensis]MBB3700863.1 uncharacterized protein (TIGR02453 family) [Flammeovirga yaeyamensis]NMF37971.1 DUF2461 domain-containing protein [Flammeovirga yaeyamensis]
MITQEVFQFLADLKENNHKDWFTENKPTYQKHHQTVKELFTQIQDELNKTDQIEGHKIYRIYRDVRFSKDKTPYKTWFSGYFSRLKPALRGGYYFHLEDGKCMIGGGFYAPNKDDLKRIRDEFTFGDQEIRGIIEDPTFKKYFGTLEGDGVKTAPKGYDKNDPAIELIRKKQFYAMRFFSNEEVLKDNFVEEVVKTFIALRPFFDYMSNVLTTDLNGESII